MPANLKYKGKDATMIPKAIKITSKLTKNQQQRLRRAAKHCEENHDVSGTAFMHLATMTYTACMPQREDDVSPDLHAVARRMMVVAGTTFRYELIDWI